MIHTIVSFRLDYQKSICAGLSLRLIQELQFIQNAVTQVLSGTSHIQSMFHQLRWLQNEYQIRFRFLFLTFRVQIVWDQCIRGTTSPGTSPGEYCTQEITICSWSLACRPSGYGQPGSEHFRLQWQPGGTVKWNRIPAWLEAVLQNFQDWDVPPDMQSRVSSGPLLQTISCPAFLVSSAEELLILMLYWILIVKLF